jgi:molybdopterin molybdotransferase
MIELEEALKKILDESPLTSIKEIHLLEVSGFVLAENVFADRDYPPFNRATMDGFAINSANFSKEKKYKLTQKIFAGDHKNISIESNECISIMTGAALPSGLDLVIKKEESRIVENDWIEFQTDKVKPFSNIAKQGEDLQTNQLVLESGTQLNSRTISLLACLGKYAVKIFAPPSIIIFSTGNEIISVDKSPQINQIRDSNSFYLRSELAKYNIFPESKIIPDKFELILKEIKNANQFDIILITGGVSEGDSDFIPKALSDLGYKIIFHKVKMKPGKPFLFAKNSENQFVFGIPGNPFSVQVVWKVFIEKFLRKILKQSIVSKQKKHFEGFRFKKTNFIEFFLFRYIKSKSAIEELIHTGSGDIKSPSFADGIAIHPAHIPEINNIDLEIIEW